MTAKSRRLISAREVEQKIGLRRTALYERIAKGEFPKPVRVSDRCSRWVEQEIDAWIAALPRGVGPRPGSAAKRAPEASAA
jgi:prophage regulatory protein